MSQRTIRRRLAEKDLQAIRPVRVPELNASHRTARLGFTREHLNRISEQWMAILFDELRIASRARDGRQPVYSHHDEWFREFPVVKIVVCERGSKMM